MSKAWHAYEDALLTIMGCSDASFKRGRETVYRLLLQPTFHKTTCIAIYTEKSVTEAQIVVLETSSSDLFPTASKRDLPLSEGDFLASRECSSDMTELSISRADRFLEVLNEVQIDTLPDADLAERDGISIRFDRLSPEGNLVVRMSSPTRREAPRHHRLVREILALAQEVFPAFGENIKILSSYLGSSTARDKFNP
jgi:hypothetical protein